MPHLGVNDRTAWRIKHSVTQAMIDREEVPVGLLQRLTVAMMRCKPHAEPKLQQATKFIG
jgi:hypothetical protein